MYKELATQYMRTLEMNTERSANQQGDVQQAQYGHSNCNCICLALWPHGNLCFSDHKRFLHVFWDHVSLFQQDFSDFVHQVMHRYRDPAFKELQDKKQICMAQNLS